MIFAVEGFPLTADAAASAVFVLAAGAAVQADNAMTETSRRHANFVTVNLIEPPLPFYS
jgi:hypothetical protein